MIEQHTNEPRACQVEHIRSVAELCDNEYYMSAAGPFMGSRERAERGRARIQQWIHELEALKEQIDCPACRQEINMQVTLQKEALREIESAWNKESK